MHLGKVFINIEKVSVYIGDNIANVRAVRNNSELAQFFFGVFSVSNINIRAAVTDQFLFVVIDRGSVCRYPDNSAVFAKNRIIKIFKIKPVLNYFKPLGFKCLSHFFRVEVIKVELAG